MLLEKVAGLLPSQEIIKIFNCIFKIGRQVPHPSLILQTSALLFNGTFFKKCKGQGADTKRPSLVVFSIVPGFLRLLFNLMYFFPLSIPFILHPWLVKRFTSTFKPIWVKCCFKALVTENLILQPPGSSQQCQTRFFLLPRVAGENIYVFVVILI